MSEITLTEEQQVLSAKLTNMERLVVLGMVAGKSQRQAYKDAGGKAKNPLSGDAVVSRMLKKVKVKAFYDSLIAATAKSSIMTREEALERLSNTARVTITDIAEFKEEVVGEDEDGNPVKQTQWRIKNSDQITPEAAAAIKSVTATKFGPKLEMHDPQAAIKQLGDLLGWNAPSKHELTGKDGQPMQMATDVSAPEIASALEGIMSRL